MLSAQSYDERSKSENIESDGLEIRSPTTVGERLKWPLLGSKFLCALAQRFISVHGFQNIGPTMYQCRCFGWVGCRVAIWLCSPAVTVKYNSHERADEVYALPKRKVSSWRQKQQNCGDHSAPSMWQEQPDVHEQPIVKNEGRHSRSLVGTWSTGRRARRRADSWTQVCTENITNTNYDVMQNYVKHCKTVIEKLYFTHLNVIYVPFCQTAINFRVFVSCYILWLTNLKRFSTIFVFSKLERVTDCHSYYESLTWPSGGRWCSWASTVSLDQWRSTVHFLPPASQQRTIPKQRNWRITTF